VARISLHHGKWLFVLVPHYTGTKYTEDACSKRKYFLQSASYCTQKTYQMFVKSLPLYQQVFWGQGTTNLFMSSLPVVYTVSENREHKIQKNLLIPVQHKRITPVKPKLSQKCTHLSFLKLPLPRHDLHAFVESTTKFLSRILFFKSQQLQFSNFKLRKEPNVFCFKEMAIFFTWM